MAYMEAVNAVRAKVAGLAPVQLEELYRRLPERGARSDDESAVAMALSVEYSAKLRGILAGAPCLSLVAEHRARVGADGRFVAAHGEPVELASNWTDVADTLLERRLGVDLYEAWEAAGGDVERDADTDAYSTFICEEVARRCASSDRLHCIHN